MVLRKIDIAGMEMAFGRNGADQTGIRPKCDRPDQDATQPEETSPAHFVDDAAGKIIHRRKTGPDKRID